MDTLVGRVVRLEPLATRHTPDLFDALGNDDEAAMDAGGDSENLCRYGSLC